MTGGLEIIDWSDRVELPPDFVLQELMALPLASIDDVLALTNQWGLAAGIGPESFKYLVGSWPGSIDRDLRQWAKDGRRDLLHPGAVEIHVKVLRTLSRHLLAHLEAAGDAALIDAWRPEGPAIPANTEQAWLWFEGYINRGLSAFSVHVRLIGAQEHSLSRPLPNLYNASCLQIARYLPGHQRVRRCANDRCQKPFTVHRTDRRKYEESHHESGVRYCSRLCAKAQSERDRRARRRAQGGSV